MPQVLPTVKLCLPMAPTPRFRLRALAAVVVMSLAVASCAEDEGGDAATEATTTEATTDEGSAQAEAATEVPVPDAPAVPAPAGGIGDPVVYTADDGWELTFTVGQVECNVEIEAEGLDPADDRFCAVELEAENTGDAPNTDEFLFGSTLLASDDQRYEVSTQASEQFLVENDMGPSVVPPGERATIPLVFSVPTDAQPQFLLLQGNADEEPVVIELS